MGSDLRVGDIMTESVVVVPFGKSASEVAKIMKKHNIGSVIVVANMNNKQAKGIITERDLVLKIVAEGKDPNTLKAEEIMNSPLRVVRPDTSIEDASKAMKENKIKRLPVVNDNNALIGMVSDGDIARVFPAAIDLIEEKAAIE